MEKKKVLFYGAGQHAGLLYHHAMRKSAIYGDPIAFVDRDYWKQGHKLFGLPVLSWEDANKYIGDNAYVYVCSNERAAPEIMGFLIEQGVASDRIINYEPLEKRYGCWNAESIFNVLPTKDKICFTSCSREEDNMQGGPKTGINGGICTVEKAVDPENLREMLRKVQRTARSITDGSAEPRHNGCTCQHMGWFFQKQKIRTLVFGGASPCNFKCCYCSQRQENYILERSTMHSPYAVFMDMVDALEREGLIDEDTVVKIGSGEYTANQNGERLVDRVKRYPTIFLTNAFIYSPATAKTLEHAGLILCSIDSGTRDTFKKIKGVDGFERVVTNLQEYARHGAVYLKYILISGVNDSEADLEGFFKLADKIAIRVDVVREVYMNPNEIYTNQTLIFIARFVKHFRERGILNMPPESIIRPNELTRFNQIMDET